MDGIKVFGHLQVVKRGDKPISVEGRMGLDVPPGYTKEEWKRTLEMIGDLLATQAKEFSNEKALA